MRKKLFCGNWKMHKTQEESKAFFNVFLYQGDNVEVMFAVSPVLLYGLANKYNILSQNFYPKAEGAYTGELSITQLKDTGAKGSLIGHSERRSLFHESLQDVEEKLKIALDHERIAVVCIGETKDQREKNQTYEVLQSQLAGIFPFLTPEFVILAYEPVWAIGTGLTATPEMAQQAHEWIRSSIVKNRGTDIAEKTRVLYGGSVKPENIVELSLQKDIDGFLVGGASLDPLSCMKMVTAMDENCGR